MVLTPEEKAQRKRTRMLEKFREYTLGTAKNKTASDFQKMIRAESAVDPRPFVTAIVDGSRRQVPRQLGQCVCITCGKVGPWKGTSMGGGMIETGHFLASRAAAIIFEETNAHPQCKHCNRHLGGNQANYELWMNFVYGSDEVDRLRQLKHTTRQFTKEELVDLRLGFQSRLKAAEHLLRR